jgi:DNA-binding CsgD family transcriptional regulator
LLCFAHRMSAPRTPPSSLLPEPLVNVSTNEARLLLETAEALRDAEGTHPALNKAVVDRLSALFRADFVAALLWDEPSGHYVEPWCHGRDASVIDSYQRHQQADPFRNHMRARAGRATSLARAIALRDLRRSVYYADHLHRYELEDGVEIVLVDQRRIVGDLRIWRSRSARRMGEHEELMLELIAPSVLKALKKYSEARVASVRQAVARASGVRLSPRELEILELMRAGNTDKEIARALDISFWTVRTHISALLRKLGVRNRTEAVAMHF